MLLFGVMAIEIKRKASHAHTVCEIVKARYVFVTMTELVWPFYMLMPVNSPLNYSVGGLRHILCSLLSAF